MANQFTDNTLMPFGKHKGKKISHIPDEYLLWLWGELELKCSSFARPLKDYLDENIEAIKLNVFQRNPKPYFND
jgi:hypothetical protein